MQLPQVLRRSPVICALALLAAVAVIFISEASYRRAIQTLDDLGAMGAARLQILRLERGLLDAETSQRGFLLTSHDKYLEPYVQALLTVDGSFKHLDHHYPDAAPARAVLTRLRAVTEASLSIMAETIRLHQAGRQDIARELVLTGMGREKMEAIRVLGAELLALESAKVASGRASVYLTLMLDRLGVALATAGMLVALYMHLRHSTVVQAHQEELNRLAQAETERLEVEVKQRTAQLTELAQHLLTAREDERNRLARDLHDELGALLTSAKLDAARIRSRLGGTSPEALERLVHLVETLNSSIALGRRIIEDLRPSTLANLGLVTALENLAREFGERSGVTVHCALEPVKLSTSAELVIYRTVQEAITNLSKHAQASRVWITLRENNDRIEVAVRDDGGGFDPSVSPPSAYGLLGMRFRIESELGTLLVTSAPGQGTILRVSLPAATQSTPPA